MIIFPPSLSTQLRAASAPPLRLRFKPGQVVWVSYMHNVWYRATVLETNVLITDKLAQTRQATYQAAYKVYPYTPTQRSRPKRLPRSISCIVFGIEPLFWRRMY
jgi:hypothetical protein